MNKEYCLYCHTNKINGKKYFGITCQTPQRRWQNGNGYKTKYFYNAIQKYGWDNFRHEVLIKGLSFDEANKLEMEYIAKYHTCIYDDECWGYNATFGGDGTLGYRHSEETKEKFKNRVISKETREKISKSVSEVNKGRIVSEETKAKISQTETGKVVSDETKQKISKAQIGRKLTEEWKNNISKHHLEIPRYNCVSVVQKDRITKDVIKTYISAAEAHRETGINNIRACLRGNQQTAGGYIWEYASQCPVKVKLKK